MMLGRLLRAPEERAVTYQQAFASGSDWLSGRSWAGVPINQDTSLTISTVYACVRMYCDTISTLPVGAYVRTSGNGRVPYRPFPQWLDSPDVGVSWADHVQQGMVSLVLDGNWFTRVYRNGLGEPVTLVVLDPTRVTVQRNAAGDIEYLWDRQTVISARDMLHITELTLPGQLRGTSRIEQMKQTLGLAQALTEFSARFFANGSITSGVIETPPVLDAEQARQIKDTFEAGHRGAGKSSRVAVLGGGSKFVKTGVDPEQAQFLQSKQHLVEEVARIFRVPPHKLGVTTPGAMSYASVEQNNIAWVTDSVRPYVSKIETAYSSLIPLRTGYVRFNLDALLRGATADRYAAHSSALQAGWETVNEVRRYEDLPPIDGGDILRVPLENVDLPAANVVEQEKRVSMAVALIDAGADPAATLAAFGLPVVPWTEDHPEPMDPAADSSEDAQDPNEPADDSPTRTVRTVERDMDGNIVRIIDEEQ